MILAVDDDPVCWRRSRAISGAALASASGSCARRSGAEALELLRQLRTRGDQVALLLADQRMPGMPGTDFLAQARKVVPDAKRVLLTAYADTTAAIAAINEVALDYYLLKPWDPPEEQLFPVLEDLLRPGRRARRSRRAACASSATASRRTSHDLRDFLARNRVPARWLDVERDGEARELLQVIGVDETRLPVALLEDGGVLEQPTMLELAGRLGITAQPTQDHYDLVIVGGGPAGPRCSGLRRIGGPAHGARRARGDGRPGGPVEPDRELPRLPCGPERLGSRAPRDRPGAPPRRRAAHGAGCGGPSRRGRGRIVELSGGGTLSANCVLIASGVAYRQLDAPGFAEFTGAGIYYGAALTEARSCADQRVVIIGGANSAGQAAVHFSGYAAQRDDARARPLARALDVELPDRADRGPAERRRPHRQLGRGRGGRGRPPPAARVRDKDGAESVLDVDACFVFIGASPRTDWLDGVVARDERGFILSGRTPRARAGR